MISNESTGRFSKVYRPAQYHTAANGKVAFIFFGAEGLFDPGDKVAAVMDNLIHTKEIPVTLAVWGVGDEFRAVDQIPKLTATLETEIFNPLLQRYPKLSTQADMHLVVGPSSPGVVAFDIAWEKNTFIGKVIADSPSFLCFGYRARVLVDCEHANANLVQNTVPIKNIRISMTTAVNDGSHKTAAIQMASAMAAAGYQHRLLIWPGDHALQSLPTFAYNLRWLWRDKICTRGPPGPEFP